ncbi:hypothetical protein P7C70_g2065, partial [Phenoliferia sp. Uapishka_3]
MPPSSYYNHGFKKNADVPMYLHCGPLENRLEDVREMRDGIARDKMMRLDMMQGDVPGRLPRRARKASDTASDKVQPENATSRLSTYYEWPTTRIVSILSSSSRRVGAPPSRHITGAALLSLKTSWAALGDLEANVAAQEMGEFGVNSGLGGGSVGDDYDRLKSGDSQLSNEYCYSGMTSQTQRVQGLNPHNVDSYLFEKPLDALNELGTHRAVDPRLEEKESNEVVSVEVAGRGRAWGKSQPAYLAKTVGDAVYEVLVLISLLVPAQPSSSCAPSLASGRASGGSSPPCPSDSPRALRFQFHRPVPALPTSSGSSSRRSKPPPPPPKLVRSGQSSCSGKAS